MKVLSQTFFNRPALMVARELLGKFLVRKINGKEIAVMISEVEAYIGPHDKACHASRGLTPRTKIMFGEAGRFYIYFTYGIHWMLNIVTEKAGYPAAVLIRGGVLERQVTRDKRQRKEESHLSLAPDHVFLNGPARLTKFLEIDKRLNGERAIPKTGLWFEDRNLKPSRIIRRKRIGVDYAGEWAEKLYNFSLGSPRKRGVI